MVSNEILSGIEQFEGVLDNYHQLWQKHNDEIIKNLHAIWKLMKTLEKENSDLLTTISKLNGELTEFRTKSEEMDATIENLRAKKEESTSKIQELNNDLERIHNDSKKPQFELETLTTKVETLNEKITGKEAEKAKLDQTKIENQNKEQALNTDYSAKMEELDKKLKQLKQANFFPTFLIEHSEEEIVEVDILATIMSKGRCNLDELKKILDVPPIMAVRTIKQMALKGIVNLNEDTNEISL